MTHLSRREFLAGVASACLAGAAEPVIDIHQHTHYWGRSDDDLVAHQRKMGATLTILLPAGSRGGLAADAYGNDSVVAVARRYPKEFVVFANEVPDLPEARPVISKYLKLGAIGIGEQKFHVECDSVPMLKIAELAQEYKVPVIMHFEYGTYNMGIERFYKVLERFPKVNFIGHAQTWWANIGKDQDQSVLYPKGKVTPGGITDRLLSDYPNIYGDLSAGSGLNSLMRDEDHAREFLSRHQDRLLFGTDCADTEGQGEKCSGAQCLAAVRRLAANKGMERKILHDNAMKLMRLG
jgi:predicted TIM-barrel fold metal-dependent hydrolase